MQSARSQSQKATRYESSHVKCPQWGNLETPSRLTVARGQWEKEIGVTADEYGVSFGGDENILKLDSGDRCMTL